MVWVVTMARVRRNLHAGLVRLLHWSVSGKPWLRLGLGNPVLLMLFGHPLICLDIDVDIITLERHY